MIRLVSVYGVESAPRFLYELLEERLTEPATNISHRGMPSWDEHLRFIRSHAYRAWYLIEADGKAVGAIYLTVKREVGIHLKKDARGKGYGSEAMRQFRRLWPGPLLANINPANTGSTAFFKSLGARLIQNTYEVS